MPVHSPACVQASYPMTSDPIAPIFDRPLGVCIHSSSVSGVGFRRILHGVGWGEVLESAPDILEVLAGTGTDQYSLFTACSFLPYLHALSDDS
jgi:hypothetical protein